MRVRFLSILAMVLLAGCEANTTSVEAPPKAAEATPIAVENPENIGQERRILAFGDSLFAGYGIGLEASYPAQLQAALRERGINAVVKNAAVSGETSGAGRQRLAFTLDAQDTQPELVILELGGNDLLRGIPPSETRANFAAMLEELRRRDIPVLLMGMRAPPNYGPDYQRDFDALYPELAAEYGADLVPFWLETIYRDPSLFQADRIHPTREGIARLVAATADEVAEALPPKP